MHEPEYAQKLGKEEIAKTLSLACFGKQSVRAVVEENIVSFLEMNLPPEVVQAFNKEVPALFPAPSGVSHKIEYLQTAPIGEGQH